MHGRPPTNRPGRADVPRLVPHHRHPEDRQLPVVLGLDLRHRERAVERQVDVVTQDQVTLLGRALETREAVPAAPCGLQQLAVVREGEIAGHVRASIQ